MNKDDDLVVDKLPKMVGFYIDDYRAYRKACFTAADIGMTISEYAWHAVNVMWGLNHTPAHRRGMIEKGNFLDIDCWRTMWKHDDGAPKMMRGIVDTITELLDGPKITKADMPRRVVIKRLAGNAKKRSRASVRVYDRADYELAVECANESFAGIGEYILKAMKGYTDMLHSDSRNGVVVYTQALGGLGSRGLWKALIFYHGEEMVEELLDGLVEIVREPIPRNGTLVPLKDDDDDDDKDGGGGITKWIPPADGAGEKKA